MGVEDDLVPAQPSDEELRIGARIAGLAQDPSDEARARIMAAVRSTPMPAAGSRRRVAMRRQWRVALAGFGATALLLGASAGALAASSDALPSSPAYGLRRFQENLRVAVADQHQQPRLRLQFAAEKLRQAKVEASHGDVSDAAKLLSDCQHDLEDAQAELHDINDPSEVQNLSTEKAQLQADAANQQGQVETIANGGTTVVPSSPPSQTPGDEQNPAPVEPAPEGPLPPAAPSAPPENSPPSPEAP
jgi:hypothetical protein